MGFIIIMIFFFFLSTVDTVLFLLKLHTCVTNRCSATILQAVKDVMRAAESLTCLRDKRFDVRGYSSLDYYYSTYQYLAEFK